MSCGENGEGGGCENRESTGRSYSPGAGAGPQRGGTYRRRGRGGALHHGHCLVLDRQENGGLHAAGLGWEGVAVCVRRVGGSVHKCVKKAKGERVTLPCGTRGGGLSLQLTLPPHQTKPLGGTGGRVGCPVFPFIFRLVPADVMSCGDAIPLAPLCSTARTQQEKRCANSWADRKELMDKEVKRFHCLLLALTAATHTLAPLFPCVCGPWSILLPTHSPRLRSSPPPPPIVPTFVIQYLSISTHPSTHTTPTHRTTA